MFENITSETLVSLITLSLLEVVLGIDNIVFISILSGKLPEAKQKLARRYGLFIGMLVRICLLAAISIILKLDKSLFEILGIGISGKDPFLVFNKKAESRYPGGSFAIAKNVSDFSKKTNLISIFSKKPIKDYLIKNIDKNLFLDLVFNKKGTDILKNRYLDINTNTKLLL